MPKLLKQVKDELKLTQPFAGGQKQLLVAFGFSLNLSYAFGTSLPLDYASGTSLLSDYASGGFSP